MILAILVGLLSFMVDIQAFFVNNFENNGVHVIRYGL